MTLRLFTCLMLLGFTVTQAYENKNQSFERIYTTSVVGLTVLKEIEDLYIEQLFDYTELLQQKLNTLKLYHQKLKQEKLDNQLQRIQYASNPIKAFGLVRRLHQDWPKWADYIGEEIGRAQLLKMDELLAKAPNSEDMTVALKGMYRIEKTYDLEAADIAEGLLWGKQYDAQLSTPECLALANYMYNKTEFTRAAKWFRLALYYNSDPTVEIFQQIYGLESKEIKKWYIISRIRGGSVDDVQLYLDELSDHPRRKLFNTIKPTPTHSELGCRGLYPPRTNLTCLYNFTTTPFLRLAPLKMEIVNMDPYIVLYHDMLYDHELIFAHNLTLSSGVDGWTDDDQPELEDERICKMKMADDMEPFVDQIDKRIKDMTGLNVTASTGLQLANYGLGGYFREHYDYVDLTGPSKLVPLFKNAGDRIVTVLFYTSTLEQGGATVFPKLNLTVWPQKGSAIVWYNMDNACNIDKSSRHSACPVIVGSRWTLTKFMLEREQLFMKPCYK